MGVDIDQVGNKGVTGESCCVLMGVGGFYRRDQIAVDDNGVILQHPSFDRIEYPVGDENLTCHGCPSWPTQHGRVVVPEVGLEPTRH
jgi:hypothetical protein